MVEIDNVRKLSTLATSSHNLILQWELATSKQARCVSFLGDRPQLQSYLFIIQSAPMRAKQLKGAPAQLCHALTPNHSPRKHLLFQHCVINSTQFREHPRYCYSQEML